MAVPDGFRAVSDTASRAWVRADLAGVPLSVWWGRGEPLSGSKGRGGVCLLTAGGVPAVVREARRGGALRNVLPDRFLSPWRVFEELRVLAELRRRGVAVVEPLAALARRRHGAWTLRLATCHVAGAAPLPRFVAEEPGLRRAAVTAAGRVVRDAFDAGLVHRDLHPDNMLARC